jgi:hypothetical protein
LGFKFDQNAQEIGAFGPGKLVQLELNQQKLMFATQIPIQPTRNWKITIDSTDIQK